MKLYVLSNWSVLKLAHAMVHGAGVERIRHRRPF